MKTFCNQKWSFTTSAKNPYTLEIYGFIQLNEIRGKQKVLHTIRIIFKN